MTAELVDFATADKRLEGALSANFQGSYDTVLLFAGDVALDGDLLAAIGKLTDDDFDLIAVAGSLAVTGRIQLYESTPGLYVGGTTTAETLEGGDCEIYIQDGTFTYLVYGYYNDGTLETGKVTTPWVINSNHDLRVSCDDAYRVDNYGDDDDCDFTNRNITESFVKDVLGKDGDEVDVRALYERLKAGQPVLVAGARTATEAALAEVTAAREAQLRELDLSNKKLKAFPDEVLRMPWLEKLVLDGNDIGKVPAGIAELAALEELSLVKCGLTALPEEIGALAKLRVLRVANNTDYRWDDAGNCTMTPIALPSTIGKLASLEVLDVSQLSTKVEGQDKAALPDITPYALPEALAQTKLRVLIADQTNVVFPKAMWGMPSLEEMSLRGSSWVYFKAFPDGLTSFANLKKLDLGTNYTRAVPDLAKLVNLEELVLSNALGLVEQPLPDLSPLKKLRVLRLAGNTGRTNVPEPGHHLLRPLFAMDLPALEELAIDRWGEKTDKVKRDHVPAAMLAGIGRFRALKKIDLEFDGLDALPDDFYTLPALSELSLRYNRLPAAERTKLATAFPRARIDMQNQKTDEKPSADALAAHETVKAANALRDRGEFDAALAKYDEALAMFEGGRVDNPYGQLYARYGKMWIHGKRAFGKSGSADDRAAWRRAGVAEAEACLRLVPAVWMIFHFTDEGQFHRECVRYATNFLAWHAYDGGGDLAHALELIERGAACVDNPSQYYVFDTQVRILIALGREVDAWRIVQRVLHQQPDFADFQDLKADARYRAWAST